MEVGGEGGDGVQQWFIAQSNFEEGVLEPARAVVLESIVVAADVISVVLHIEADVFGKLGPLRTSQCCLAEMRF